MNYVNFWGFLAIKTKNRKLGENIGKTLKLKKP